LDLPRSYNENIVNNVSDYYSGNSQHVQPCVQYSGYYPPRSSTFNLPYSAVYSSCSPFPPLGNASALPTSSVPEPPCPGTLLNWGPSFFMTYPLPIHAVGCNENPGYYLSITGKVPDSIITVSNRCRGKASKDGGACLSCSTLSTLAVDSVRNRASGTRSRRAASYRSHTELVDALELEKQERNALQMKVCPLPMIHN